MILSSYQDDPIQVIEDQLEGVWQVHSWTLNDQQIIENGEVDIEYWQDLNYQNTQIFGNMGCYSCPLELNFQKADADGIGTVGVLE